MAENSVGQTLSPPPVFVDTSVLIYASIKSAPFHSDAVGHLQQLRSQASDLWISRQVLREYLAVLSRPQTFTTPLSATTLEDDIRRFGEQFRIAEDSGPVTHRLLALMKSTQVGGKQVHDANIVATMLVYGITHLLTHNTADFARFTSHITVLPIVL